MSKNTRYSIEQASSDSQKSIDYRISTESNDSYLESDGVFAVTSYNQTTCSSKSTNSTFIKSYFSKNTSKKSTSSSDSLRLDESLSIDIKILSDEDLCRRKSKIISYNSLMKKSKKKKNSFEFNFLKDDLVGNQYKVIKNLGQGTFSQVFLCKDLKDDSEVALKVFTKKNQIGLVKTETLIAMHLKNLDPSNVYQFVKMLDVLKYQRQFFIVYENLSVSIYDFMTKFRKKPYTINEIRKIGYQICKTLDFLHKNNVIHSDIKPENILFTDPLNYSYEISSLKIKIIDFGSSIINSPFNIGIVTTRHYRAPEVILKLEWSYPIDVWSVGCVLFEMYKEELLFPPVKSNLEHIAIMWAVLGEIPESMQNTKPYYFEELKKIKKSDFKDYIPLKKYFPKTKESLELLELLKKMFIYEPTLRPTMKKLMKDKFFKSIKKIKV